MEPLALTLTRRRYATTAKATAAVIPKLIENAIARVAAKRTAALPITMEAVKAKKTSVQKRMIEPVKRHQPTKQTKGKIVRTSTVLAKSCGIHQSQIQSR